MQNYIFPARSISWLVASVYACFLFPIWTKAQLALQPGDLAILAINANNRLCSPNASADDLVSFVCFKDIPPGTTLDFTDNGWERLLPERWGNSEGFVTALRTGATIPAGTVITFRFPPIGSQPYQSITPDTNWVFSQRSPNILNLNSGGDQLYLLQGGTWKNNGVGFDFKHDAEYIGGNILFGFNTTSSWESFTNSSQDSGLHPAVDPCYQMAPTSGATDFISYTGPTSPASQLEWIGRIRDPKYWTAFESCLAMPTLPTKLDLLLPGIQLTCTTCKSCEPYTEVLTLQLPQTGGPFQIIYSDGNDTFVVNNLKHKDTILYSVRSTTTLRLLSAADAQGCPVYSNLGSPLELRISPLQVPVKLPIVSACGLPGSNAVFNLSSQDSILTQHEPGFTAHWFRDSILKNPITQPASFSSPAGTVYALVSDGVCFLPPIPIKLEILETPSATLPLGGRLCGEEPCLDMPVQFKGVPPFLLTYDLSLPGKNPVSTEKVFQDSNSLWSICPDSMGVTQGDVIFQYKTLTDARGCSLDVEKQISVVRRGKNGIKRIQPVLCPGQTFDFLDKTYDAQHPTDTIVLVNSTTGGCDSLVIIELRFTDSLAVELTGDYSICAGQPLRLNWKLRGGTQFDIIYQDGETAENMTNKELKGVRNGDALELWPTQSTPLRILNVQARESGCSFRPGLVIPLLVNDLSLSASQIARFGGAAVSCAGGNDGRATAFVRGGIPPYRTIWSTGDTTLQVHTLRTGIYTLTVTDQKGCTQTQSVHVKEPAPITPLLEITPAPCTQTSGRIILQRIAGGVPPFSYSLDGQDFKLINQFPTAIPNLSSGSYTLHITDANLCDYQRAVELPQPTSLVVDLGPDRVIAAGDSVSIFARVNFTPAQIKWTPDHAMQQANSLHLTVQPSQTTIYRVDVTDTAGCTTSDAITIRVEHSQQVFAPNAFSPNGDGQNDVFQIFPGSNVLEISALRIFNRWGTQVFEQKAKADGTFDYWDGRVMGNPAPTGTYVFVAELTLRDGSIQHINGAFMLMR